MPDSKSIRGSKQQVDKANKLDTDTMGRELRRFLKPVTDIELQLNKDVEKIKADNGSLASGLKSLGYIVRSVKISGGGDGVDCFHNLKHEYLEVFVPGDMTGDRFVVDDQFRDQFTIAPSSTTDRYSFLHARLPSTLVLQQNLIPPLISFICFEMSAAFKATQKEIPPWRKLTSMLTKWAGNLHSQSEEKDSSRRKSRDQRQSDQQAPPLINPITRVHGFLVNHLAI